MNLRKKIYDHIAQNFSTGTFTARDVPRFGYAELAKKQILHSMIHQYQLIKVVKKSPSRAEGGGRWLNVYQVADLGEIQAYQPRPDLSKSALADLKTNAQIECANRLFAAMNWGAKHAQKMPSPRP